MNGLDPADAGAPDLVARYWPWPGEAQNGSITVSPRRSLVEPDVSLVALPL
jgi:hypothetical protein